MSKRKKEAKDEPTVFDKARNELFSQIRHCGVLQATADQRDTWFKDTVEYLAKRYPAVSQEELTQLDALGRRYCEPVTPYGGETASVSEGTT